jgi:hypothetical protein
MRDSYRILKLALKYWAQGDSWSDAKAFAVWIVKGFKKEWKNNE